VFRYYFIIVLINVLVWYCKRKVEEECLFVLLYIAWPRGITSAIAIAIVPRYVYIVIDEGANNKIVVQKKMIVSFLFVLKF